MKRFFLPAMLLAVFEAIAITLWLTQENLFYLFNFSYIGISLSLGIFLFIKKTDMRAGPLSFWSDFICWFI